ncbi:enolase C-terminal domain-like protein [Aspergillus keveii]|uniref:Enolase C-terminal domain-like protein n=1 Tax=Aspergillus keveii TaxID=714993 RepID=A0ABR4GKU3_9EURO
MTDLTITRIDVFQAYLPYSGGIYTLSKNRTYTSFDATFVRITTSTGLEGWGESTPFGSTYVAAHALGVRAGIAEIAPHLIGLDPRHVDRINEAMDDALLGHEHAKAAIDIACWDVFGKAVGMPVCDLLGGRTDGRCAPQAGYVGHSIKIAGVDPVADAARITAALADRQPGEMFLVDANGGLTVETALRMLRLLPASGLDLILEAPCATWRECLSLRRRTDVPIHFDELASTDASIVQLLADDAVEGIGMKISKNGGLTRCRRQRDMCIAAGYTFSVQDTVGSDISFAAIVHMAQTVPDRYLRCILETRDMVTLKTADGPFEVVNGRLRAPALPGLGVTPRMEVLGEPVAGYC